MRVWLEAKDDEEVRKQLSKWGDAFFETKKAVLKDQKDKEDVLLYGSSPS